ncbi:MAG TPA: T9SS type A sorting domain-containing protein [Bacteroidia bacterium]|nr:T9SS type A sorting domain-containing protein [Bacteroidia bacterium]
MLYNYSSALFLTVRYAYILLILTVNPISAFSQNYVPNPSFEEIDTCPSDLNYFEKAVGWRSILNTPDLFNNCSQGRVSIPTNQFGYQELKPNSGFSYAGLASGIGSSGLYNEIIGIKLNETLISGQRYFLSFDFSSGFNVNGQVNCQCFVNKLGVKFLTHFEDTNNISQTIINNTATLFSDSVLSDTSNWLTFSGSFIADSSYSYLLIGNFFTQDSMTFNCIDVSSSISYTYLDNICLSQNLNDCNGIIADTKLCSFNLFPNPSSGKFSIHSDEQYFNNSIAKVYNSIGELILKQNMKGGENIFDFSNLNSGLYLIVLNECILKITLY